MGIRGGGLSREAEASCRRAAVSAFHSGGTAADGGGMGISGLPVAGVQPGADGGDGFATLSYFLSGNVVADRKHRTDNPAWDDDRNLSVLRRVDLRVADGPSAP